MITSCTRSPAKKRSAEDQRERRRDNDERGATVVEQFLKAFQAGDAENTFALIHPDVVIHEAAGLPYAGDHVGIEGLGGLVGQIMTLAAVTVDSFEVIAAGDQALAKIVLTFTSDIRRGGGRYRRAQGGPTTGCSSVSPLGTGSRSRRSTPVVSTRSGSGRPAGPDETVLLHLHGGGFAMGFALGSAELASRLAEAAGARCLVVDYRLAPEHPFPAALDDSAVAYQWVLGIVPAGWVFVVGESSGGGLALASVLVGRERDLPDPAGVIALSPLVDLPPAPPRAPGQHAHRWPWRYSGSRPTSNPPPVGSCDPAHDRGDGIR